MINFISYRRLGTIILGLLISFVALKTSLHEVVWRDVAQTITKVPLILGAGCAACLAAGICFRGLRWWVLLREPVPGPMCFSGATFSGACANQVLPGRLGELFKIYVLSRWGQIGLACALGSAILDRACDALVLVLTIIALAMFLKVEGLGSLNGGILTLIVSGVVLGLFIALSGRLRAALERWTERAASGWSLKPAIFLSTLFDLVGRQFDVAQAQRLILCAALVLGADYGAIALAVASAGLSLPAEAPLLLWVALASSAMVPAGPAHLGVYQWAAVWSLGVYAVPRHEAVAVAFILQALLFAVSVTGATVFFLSRRPRSLPH